MKANYNVTGKERKALVAAIAELTGDKAIYKFMPTCAFEIGDITVDKENGVTYSVALLLEGQTEKEHVKEFNPKTDKPEKLELLKDTSFFKNMANQDEWNVTKIVRQ